MNIGFYFVVIVHGSSTLDEQIFWFNNQLEISYHIYMKHNHLHGDYFYLASLNYAYMNIMRLA